MNYIEKNRGFITKSKLFLYMQSKEAYWRVYELEQPTDFVKESKALDFWTKVDLLMTDPKQFEEQYFLNTKGNLLKHELQAMCDDRGIPYAKSTTVADLKALLFGNREVIDGVDAEKLVAIQKELARQPLYDYGGDYLCQEEIVAELYGHKIKGTIDRLSVEKKLIRDLKTSKDIEYLDGKDMIRLQYNLENWDEYGYGMQLAWYYMLCLIRYDQKFAWVLDCVGTVNPYAYVGYQYDVATLEHIAIKILFPAMQELAEDLKVGESAFLNDSSVSRDSLVWCRYYQMLEQSIQDDFVKIEPNFL